VIPPLPLPSPLLAMVRAAMPLAQSLAEDAAAPVGPYHYTHPFLQPLPVWNYWPWLLVPLAVAVAVVYKSIKCSRVKQVPKEAAVLTLWILGGMVVAAGVLAVMVKLVERAQS
jgi:hypothetical protein